MKSKKVIIISGILLLFVGVSIWRLVPRNFDSIIGGKKEFTDLIGTSILSITKDGVPYTESSTMNIENNLQKGEELLKIFKSNRYRPSLKNLLFLEPDGYSSTKATTKIIYIKLKKESSIVNIHLYDEEFISVSVNGGRDVVYYPTDPNLVHYIHDFIDANKEKE